MASNQSRGLKSPGRRITTLLATLGVVALAMVGVGGAAGASGSGDAASNQAGVQARLDDHLRNIPGSRQVNSTEIAWEIPGLGEAGIVVPTATAPAPCPANKFCFYKDADYRGELRYYPPCAKTGVDYYLEGFRDQTSSWKNTTGKTTWVYNWGFPHRERLWTMNAGLYSRWVGTDKNDKADYFRC